MCPEWRRPIVRVPTLAELASSGVLRERIARSMLIAGGVAAVLGCAAVSNRAVDRPAASSQALRACVDRWNQDNMLGWGSMSVRTAVRAPSPAERRRVSLGKVDDAQP